MNNCDYFALYDCDVIIHYEPQLVSVVKESEKLHLFTNISSVRCSDEKNKNIAAKVYEFHFIQFMFGVETINTRRRLKRETLLFF